MSSINDSPAQSPAPASGPGDESGYPEQRHAGAVGYGPEYMKGATTGDKLAGIKEEVKGKLFRKPDLVEHGREMRTGELKKKQQEDDANPFANAKEDPSEKPAASGQRQASGASGAHSPDAPNPNSSYPPAMSDTTHASDKGAREQAAATAPEGTEKAQRQKTGGNTDNVSYIG
ncbi:hypothetical protein TRAPUB_2067 [Trametes pubescens]|uniref:Uncharacterized protein n=1 Tax=Trametes pubescens TaxID=154538 RepID=A0A1M2VHK5_TRAPU|nr:hypothetical protein TRAPUB_2067 [Trametes pubescens]